MAIHRIEVLYCHVLESGLRNARRLSDEGNAEKLGVELAHLQAVNQLLTLYLLYGFSGYPDASWTGVEHEAYWQQTRVVYMQNADPRSLEELKFDWEMLREMIDALQETGKIPR